MEGWLQCRAEGEEDQVHPPHVGYTDRGRLGSHRPRELGPLQLVYGPLALRENTAPTWPLSPSGHAESRVPTRCCQKVRQGGRTPRAVEAHADFTPRRRLLASVETLG